MKRVPHSTALMSILMAGLAQLPLMAKESVSKSAAVVEEEQTAPLAAPDEAAPPAALREGQTGDSAVEVELAAVAEEPNPCGGAIRLIALVKKDDVNQEILSAMHLPTGPPKTDAPTPAFSEDEGLDWGAGGEAVD